MAAGQGFKTFTTGEVLTAADVNGYLMQGVLVFASAAARDAAITSPQEGQFAYLKDTNVTTYYTGSAWTNLDTTGMTNPMTTTGDMVYSSSGSTPARLGIGTTGQVLSVAGGIPSWATPAVASSGLTLIAAQTVTSSSTVNVNSVFSGTYQNYTVYFQLIGAGGSTDDLRMRVGGADNSNASTYIVQKLDVSNTTVTASRVTSNLFDNVFLTSAANAINRINFYQPFEAEQTAVEFNSGINGEEIKIAYGRQTNSTSFDGFSLLFAGAVTGTVWVYGWKETV